MQKIILAGLQFHPICPGLRARLASRGFAVDQASSTAQLQDLLRGQVRPAAVVVYSSDESETALEFLSQMAAAWKPATAVVLAERSDFSQYYRLMAGGASYYYDVSEDLETIARGVSHAARRPKASDYRPGAEASRGARETAPPARAPLAESVGNRAREHVKRVAA